MAAESRDRLAKTIRPSPPANGRLILGRMGDKIAPPALTRLRTKEKAMTMIKARSQNRSKRSEGIHCPEWCDPRHPIETKTSVQIENN
jgi:hypothetical protein